MDAASIAVGVFVGLVLYRGFDCVLELVTAGIWFAWGKVRK